MMMSIGHNQATVVPKKLEPAHSGTDGGFFTPNDKTSQARHGMMMIPEQLEAISHCDDASNSKPCPRTQQPNGQ
jgi:hypothetical protein